MGELTTGTVAGVKVPDVKTDLFIDGRWSEASAGATFEVICPATEERIATVAAGTAADIDRAVIAARNAFDTGSWASGDGSARGVLLNRLADLIERDLDIFVTLEALDVGRPAFEPRAVDIPNVIDVFRHFAGWADKIQGRALTPPPAFGRQRFAYTRREPVGVVGAITAWNVPTMLAAWKLAPALAAGCTVVLKPAEDACLTAIYLAQLAEEVGFPAGVLNVVTGAGAEAGAALVSHPGVDKITFTGSPEVGRTIAVACARDMRRVTLELGGKSPQVILPGANLEQVIPGVAGGFLANQGEVCAAGTRIFVASELVDEFASALGGALAGVRLGAPFDEQTTMGALINEKQHRRVTGYIEAGASEGAELIVGGSVPDRAGYFVEPTLFVGRENGNELTIAKEEIFGPVGLVIPFDDLDDAVRQANATQYGLGAYIWTDDVTLAHETAARLRAGSVWINGPGAPDPRLPWGGFKQSGVGRELGYAGIEENTEEKSVTITLS